MTFECVCAHCASWNLRYSLIMLCAVELIIKPLKCNSLHSYGAEVVQMPKWSFAGLLALGSVQQVIKALMVDI